MKTPPVSSWAIGIAFAAVTGMASAQNLAAPEEGGTQIGWASEAFAHNLMADGQTTFEEHGESIRFELGTFAPGFDPTTATQDQWASNWIVLQGVDYDLVDQQFIQTATLRSNDSPFTLNTQAYIWGYTSKSFEETSQWILVAAPSWKWPASTSPLPTTFSMSDARPQDALMGSVNPESGDYHMHFEYVVVPEPSAALLACVASLGLVLRRRR